MMAMRDQTGTCDWHRAGMVSWLIPPTMGPRRPIAGPEDACPWLGTNPVTEPSNCL